ncbi:MAG: SGNH/GDSL hydrolase family protein [Candidatus Liptonbacteria bacterium]|nr:SGNH/GDSL hydrolase family protein [Candidatus Liptonbacteria bacterium]
MSLKKKIVFSLIVLAVLFVAAEFILRFVAGFLGVGTDAKLKMEPYQGKSWLAQYAKDGVDCRDQTMANGHRGYARFLLWDMPLDCATPTLNYSWENDRTRKTWNPTVDSDTPKSAVKTIAMFGGSTLEGVGAIDDETIPSWVSRGLNATSTSNGTKYVVTNYGMSGYTYTQSVMKLVLKLREGKHFDYVIFYGGANDIDNSYDNGVPGALFQENWTKTQLQGTDWERFKLWMSDRVQSCDTCKALAVIARNTPFLKQYFSPILVNVRNILLQKQGVKQAGGDLGEFAQGIADYYADSHDLLDTLSKAYGFKYFEFWQPTLVLDTPTPGEVVIVGVDPHLTDPKSKSVFQLTRDAMLALKLNNFYDLTDALKGRTSAYYLDAVHVSGDANKVIAERMLELTERSLGK